MRRVSWLIAACVSLVACSSDSGPPPTPTPTAPTSATGSNEPARPTFDPPRSFDTSTVIGLSAVPKEYLHAGRDAVYSVRVRPTSGQPSTSPAEVSVLHPSTGKALRSFRLDAITEKPEQMRFAELAGQVVLFTGYHYVERGTGTAVDQHFLRVRRYSLTDGKAQWSVDIPLPSVAALRNVFVVAVTDQHVVISAREREVPGAEISRNSVAVVLATDTGERRWIRERFIPYAVAGDVVAGTTPKPDRTEEPNRVEALHARTGAAVWQFSGFNIDRGDPFGFAVGDRLVQITTRRPGDGLGGQVFTAHLVDIATGKAVIQLDNDAAYTCVHDRAQLIVCHVEVSGNPTIAAYDATSYQRLWVLDRNTPGRRVPTMLIAYRGLLYVEVSNRGSTLDGKTGADANPSLGLVPSHVGPGYAIGRDRDGLRLYPATG